MIQFLDGPKRGLAVIAQIPAGGAEEDPANRGRSANRHPVRPDFGGNQLVEQVQIVGEQRGTVFGVLPLNQQLFL